MKKYLKFCFLIAGLSACYKDTKTNNCAYEDRFDFENSCREVDEYIYPEADENGMSSYWLLKYMPETERLHPCYNPNNPNEIVFYLWDREGDSTTHELVLGNLQSGDHQLLCSLNKKGEGGELIWSVNNDLISAFSLLIINVETKKKYEFDPKIGLFNPVWDKDGENIYAWLRGVFDEDLKAELENETLVRISWPEKQVFKTGLFKEMSVLRQPTAISKSNNLCYSNDGIIYQMNIESNESRILFESEVNIGNGGGDYEWHPETGRLYFSSLDGIFYIEDENNRQVRIKKSCTSRYYESFSISPAGDKIVASRRDIKAERDGTYISENTKLVIMDIDGCNEKVLFEDWDGTVIGRP